MNDTTAQSRPPSEHAHDSRRTVPVVLVVSGLDPSGGAGVQADIEALASMGCHTAPVVSALTVQDTHRVTAWEAVDAGLLARQLEAIGGDMNIAACKIGMVASRGIVEAVHAFLRERTSIPVVLDPVLGAGGGGALSDDDTFSAVLDLLVPLATVVTPNGPEARRMAAGSETLDQCAQALLGAGAEFVLITGGHEDTPLVVNSLYGEGRLIEAWPWERLAGSYHGSGCTLAAAIAGLLASGTPPLDAIRQAQEYTWETLRQAYFIGTGQHIPNRLFWAKGEDEVMA